MGQIVGMAGNFRSQTYWEGSVDQEWYRTYKINWLILPAYGDGPANIMRTPGLPLPGSVWNFDLDFDPWVWCRPEMTVKGLNAKQDRPEFYVVEQTFSNRPYGNRAGFQGCQDVRIDNPILQPMKVGGGFVRRIREASVDRFSNPLVTSSWEQLRGNQVEFDADTDQVKVEQNVLDLGLATVEAVKNHVNRFPMWGVPARCIKFAEFTWDRQLYGQCFVYYVRKFTFDIDFDTWDRCVLDEGTKCLQGHWDAKTGLWIDDNVGGLPPDPNNPTNFMRYVDRQGNTARVILDGNGRPWNPALSQTVTTCGGCEGGSPRNWQVFNADPAFTGKVNNLILIYDKGCTWKSKGAELMRVTVDPADPSKDYWQLTDLDTNTTWTLTRFDWKCKGPNVMSLPGTEGENGFDEDDSSIFSTVIDEARTTVTGHWITPEALLDGGSTHVNLNTPGPLESNYLTASDPSIDIADNATINSITVTYRGTCTAPDPDEVIIHFILTDLYGNTATGTVYSGGDLASAGSDGIQVEITQWDSGSPTAPTIMPISITDPEFKLKLWVDGNITGPTQVVITYLLIEVAYTVPFSSDPDTPYMPKKVTLIPTNSQPGFRCIQYYREADLMQLGLPLIL